MSKPLLPIRDISNQPIALNSMKTGLELKTREPTTTGESEITTYENGAGNKDELPKVRG